MSRLILGGGGELTVFNFQNNIAFPSLKIDFAAQRHSKHKTVKNIKDTQKKYRLGTVSKIFFGGLKPVPRRRPHP